jgi:hypothetical protein
MPMPQMLFTIKEGSKGIPYAGTGVRDDGTENHGFFILKGKPAEASAIAEVQDNPPMKNALVAINDSSTAFFTAGCEKSFNHDSEGYWAKGYIEVSYNYVELASDAQHYFKLFFDFNNRIRNMRFDAPIQYHWELEAAVFTDVSWQTHGFTVGVWIRTASFESQGEVQNVWAQGVDFLVEYFKGIKAFPQQTSIY